MKGAIAALLMISALPAAAQYSARQDGDVIHLEDAKYQTVISILPSVGNVTYEMKVKGINILQFPFADLAAFRQRPALAGIPFLGPWANRLDEFAFYANGKKYPFNPDLGNVRGTHPSHGFLSFTGWQIVEVKADATGAWVTSRLDVYKQPAWMAQFPFAHTLEITHRLRDGVLEVNLKIHNLSAEPMPVSVGFHPWFQLTDAPRDQWTIAVGARTQWLLTPDKLPTGEVEPIERFFPDPKAAVLKDYNLDHVFGDLIRDSSGRAAMTVTGKTQKIEVLFGPNYRASVIYAPQGRNFICFEPMAGISNAMNLAQKGLYKELQSLPPGDTWQESFWVHPTGF